MTHTQRYTVTVPPSAQGTRLSLFLSANGYPLNAACGGAGRCGKCLVTLERGAFSATPDGTTPLVPNETGEIRACRAFCTDKEAVISFSVDERVTDLGVTGHKATSCAGEQRYAVALDIGTTTLAAALVTLPSGAVLHTQSVLNPCIPFGADVVSRIAAAQNGLLAAMQGALLSSVRDLLAYFKEKLPANATLETLACVGNTTMLHLFWGISPMGMATYPFTPAFTDAKATDGSVLSLDVATVVSLPCQSAFFGADALAGIIETRLFASPAPALLLDLGTNGELALYTGGEDGRLYVTSTAAGPAFEGAGISSGVGGVRGAVSRITPRGMTAFSAETIGSEIPIGICSSGLVDLISVLRLQGRLDETGYLKEDLVVYAQGKDTPLSVTREDIRAFQVAKSAVRAGIDTLLNAAGLTACDLATLYLGGGMGHYLHKAEAQLIGLLPSAAQSVRSVQNCALGGAVTFLKLDCNATPYREIAKRCIHVDLASSPVFSSAFMAHMRLSRS